jgi:Na+/H+ antiporter NhaA
MDDVVALLVISFVYPDHVNGTAVLVAVALVALAATVRPRVHTTCTAS